MSHLALQRRNRSQKSLSDSEAQITFPKSPNHIEGHLPVFKIQAGLAHLRAFYAQWVGFGISRWIPASVFIYNSLSAFKIKCYCIVHLLMLVLPRWDVLQAEKHILTLGIALAPLIIWKLHSTTCPQETRDMPRLLHIYMLEQTTIPFISTSFQVLPAWHLPSCTPVTCYVFIAL